MNEIEGVKHNYLTDGDRYSPTPAEERLLEILLNPDNLGKTIVEKCNLAKIARNTYYEIMKKPEFVKLQNSLAVDMIRDKVSDVLAASVKVATTSGARGFQDRQMLLRMYGLDVKEDENRVIIVNIGD